MDTAFNPALVQLSQRFHEASLGGGPVDPTVLLGKAGDLLSSAEATTQYSSSESSSAADNLNCHIDSSGLLDTYPGNGSRPNDAVRQGGSLSQDGKAQICFDFTKGVCSRGDKCKYSHDLATIVHFNSKEKGICFDYLRNQCHRGLLCRFSHDLSNIAQQCQVYNNGSKENKGTKPNAICYDFVKGVCQRGAECRYSHDLSLIARMARGGSAQPKAGEVCYDYLRGRCNRGATCKYSHNIAFLAAPGFLGSALSSDGAPIAAQAPGAGLPGARAPLGIPLAGAPGFAGMGGLPGMPPRLTTALSADQATLNHVLAAAGPGAVNQMLAAQAAFQQSNGLAAAAAAEAAVAAAEGRRRSASLTGETANDTLLVNDQPQASWSGMANGPKALAVAQQAALMSNFAAQQQRMALANMQAFGPLAQLPGLTVQGATPSSADVSAGDGLLGAGAPGMPAGMFGKPALGQFSNGTDAGTQGLRRPPLPPGQIPAELAAFFAGGMPENPALFAETLAAAAKAQAQNQTARIMAAAVTSGANAVQPSSGLTTMGSGGAAVGSGQAVPQPIPGREGVLAPHSYDAGTNGQYGPSSFSIATNSQSGGGASVENGHLSRSAPSSGPLNPVNVNPDLLPMIKEIWSKPGGP